MAQSKIEEYGNEELMFHFLLIRDSLITILKALEGTPDIEGLKAMHKETFGEYEALLNEIYRRMENGSK